MKIQRKLLIGLSVKERSELRKLTVSEPGGMRDLLSVILKKPMEYGTAEVFLCRDNGKLIAWSAIAPSTFTYSGRTELWVYVKRAYRRIGLGTKLYKKAKRRLNSKHRKHTIAPWNEAGNEFFRAQGHKI